MNNSAIPLFHNSTIPQSRTVILAAGSFPRKGGVPWRILASAERVVCCDGAADAYRRRFGRDPDVVVGDCDSLRGRFSNVVKVAEQETNDLCKAYRHCVSKGWDNPVVLGATGRRDDHTLANVFLALDIGLIVVTDYGRFVPVEGDAAFHVAVGTPISVFAPDPTTRMTSSGLEWPLDGHVFANLYSAALNRADAEDVALTSTRRVYVFLGFFRRAIETSGGIVI